MMSESEEVLLEKIKTLEDENKILKEEKSESTKKLRNLETKELKQYKDVKGFSYNYLLIISKTVHYKRAYKYQHHKYEGKCRCNIIILRSRVKQVFNSVANKHILVSAKLLRNIKSTDRGNKYHCNTRYYTRK